MSRLDTIIGAFILAIGIVIGVLMRTPIMTITDNTVMLNITDNAAMMNYTCPQKYPEYTEQPKQPRVHSQTFKVNKTDISIITLPKPNQTKHDPTPINEDQDYLPGKCWSNDGFHVYCNNSKIKIDGVWREIVGR